MMNLSDFQAYIGLQFVDLSLLQRALTHRSYLNEHPHEALEDNERLEFLGDAVLDFIAADWLYHHFPESTEGRMTRMRAALVRTETLALFAQQIRLGDALYLGKGEEEGGGRTREGNLCAAFEALVGAIYLDKDAGGLEVVQRFIYPFFKQALEDMLVHNQEKDPKSRLQEWSQANLHQTPYYRMVSATGPDHAREFTIEVRIGGEAYGQGAGRSKQSAAQQAARNALKHIRQRFVTQMETTS